MVAMRGTCAQGFSPGSESSVSICVTDTASCEIIPSSDLCVCVCVCVCACVRVCTQR